MEDGADGARAGQGAVEDGKTNEAKNAALVFAILCDKSAVLEVGAAAARTRVVDGGFDRPVLDPPDDAERLREIGRLMRDIGVLGDDDRRDDGDDRRPPELPLLPPPISDPEPCPSPTSDGAADTHLWEREAVRIDWSEAPVGSVAGETGSSRTS